jgi:hypothetical protein
MSCGCKNINPCKCKNEKEEKCNLLIHPSSYPVPTELKAMALLEFDFDFDNTIRESIYYFWSKYVELPKFPILNTEGSASITVKYLDKYYKEGYRIFLGFNRSTMLSNVLYWFDNHPDAVGISLQSTANSLNIEKQNVYRLAPDDSNIYQLLLPIINITPKVYYIYSENELACIDFLTLLQTNPNTQVIPYPVRTDLSNCTVADFQNLFSSATSADIVISYLFNQQPYFDLYNAGLTFDGNQYDISSQNAPLIIGTAKTILNNKLYLIKNIYPNTSSLWRENADYLTIQNGTPSSSGTLINGLKMIQYIQERKNINTLGSHLGILEFNSVTRDLLYPSYLTLIYQETEDSFVKSSIVFNDPLLGKFQATFV